MRTFLTLIVLIMRPLGSDIGTYILASGSGIDAININYHSTHYIKATYNLHSLPLIIVVLITSTDNNTIGTMYLTAMNTCSSSSVYTCSKAVHSG